MASLKPIHANTSVSGRDYGLKADEMLTAFKLTPFADSRYRILGKRAEFRSRLLQRTKHLSCYWVDQMRSCAYRTRERLVGFSTVRPSFLPCDACLNVEASVRTLEYDEAGHIRIMQLFAKTDAPA